MHVYICSLMLRSEIEFRQCDIAWNPLLKISRSATACLIALKKENGGVRPIAISCILRCLIAKTASMAFPKAWVFVSPQTIWIWHLFCLALRLQLTLLKLTYATFISFFNWILGIPSGKTRCLYKYISKSVCSRDICSFYSSASLLQFCNTMLHLAEGIRQGDPLCPLLFCLAIHSLVSQLKFT